MRRFALSLLLLLSACALAPQAPAPGAEVTPAGKAAVHIYRRTLPFSPANISIYDAGRQVGTLQSGTYLDYLADPGPRSLKALGAGAGSIPYATSFRAGQTYYLMVYFLGDQIKGDASLMPVDPTTALAQIASLKPASP